MREGRGGALRNTMQPSAILNENKYDVICDGGGLLSDLDGFGEKDNIQI